MTLYVLPIGDSQPRGVLSLAKQGSLFAICSDKPLWSPDGKELLVALPEAVEAGETHGAEACPLYLVPEGGGKPERIGALPENGQWTLSPDGTRLALVTGEPRGEVWVLEGA